MNFCTHTCAKPPVCNSTVPIFLLSLYLLLSPFDVKSKYVSIVLIKAPACCVKSLVNLVGSGTLILLVGGLTASSSCCSNAAGTPPLLLFCGGTCCCGWLFPDMMNVNYL